MLDLISTSEDLHYENYRQTQMETRKFGEAKVKKLDNPKFKEEEEQLRKKFTEQVKSEEARFRQWEQHVRIPYSWYSMMYSFPASVNCRERSFEQGPGNGPQRHQATRSRVGKSPGRLSGQRQAMNTSTFPFLESEKVWGYSSRASVSFRLYSNSSPILYSNNFLLVYIPPLRSLSNATVLIMEYRKCLALVTVTRDFANNRPTPL